MTASDERSVLREHLERYRSVTVQTLEMTPEEQLGWRPQEGLRSFGEQFLHIAQTEDFYAYGVFENDWNRERLQPSSEPLSRAVLRRHLDETRARTLSRFDALGASRFDLIISVPNTPVQWPLRSWLWYVVEHEIHHKSQVSLYLRRLGIVPPFFAYALPPGMRPDVR